MFYGKVVTEWSENGRDMVLLEDVSFEDKSGLVWHAPKGSVINGASIPRFFWRIVGAPFAGKYRRASVIHDVHCDLKQRPSPHVHRVFWEAMREDGVGPIRAWVMWLAVRLGGPRFRGGGEK